MRLPKKEDLLKKIKISKSKIEAEQSELTKLTEQLIGLEKDGIYQIILKNGLTIEEAEKILIEFSAKKQTTEKSTHEVKPADKPPALEQTFQPKS